MDKQEESLTSAQMMAYNMGLFLIERLNSLLSQASTCYLKGNLRTWYFHLKVIQQDSQFCFTQSERSSLRILKGKIEDKESPQAAYFLIEKYDSLLKDIMGKHGLLIKPLKDTTRLFGQG